MFILLGCFYEKGKFNTSPSLMFWWEIYEFLKIAIETGEPLY